MSHDEPTQVGSLAGKIDQLADAFEHQWRAGAHPCLEEYLVHCEQAQRAALLRELLVVELDLKHRAGAPVLEEEYVRRFAVHQQVVSEVFASLFPRNSDTPALLTGQGSTVATPPGVLPQENGRRKELTELPCAFGEYDLLEKLGQGGMGVVFKARQRSANRLVALKLIRPENLTPFLSESRAEWLARFRNEVEAAAKLDHDHVVTVYDVGQVDGLPYYAMRYVGGKSLYDKLKDGPLEPKVAAHFTEQIAQALSAAHAHGILHRDIKPHNILVDSHTDRALLTDFGLAKLTALDQQLTATHARFGSPPYMSPEQALDAGKVTVASDVYSLGATLYHLLTGRPPFQASSPTETLRQVVEAEPVTPRLLNPAIPRDLETICLKCLQKRPDDRYQSASEVAVELRRFLDGVPIQARPVGRLERMWRWCKRKPMTVGLYAAVIATVLSLGVAWHLGETTRNARQLARLNDAFNSELATLELTADHLTEAEAAIAAISALDPEAEQTLRKKLYGGFADRIDTEIHRPRLVPKDRLHLEDALTLLESRDGARARELRGTLKRRLSGWQPVFELSAPFDSLATVFIPTRVRVQNSILLPTQPPKRIWQADNRPPLLDHSEPILTVCENSARLEAVFDESWKKSVQLGLWLNARENRGYHFVLRLPDESSERIEEEESDEFRGLGVAEIAPDMAVLEIRKNGISLQRQSISMERLKKERLTLRATRERDWLRFHVNDLPPLEFQDLFPISDDTPGAYAVDWPRDTGLVRLVAERRNEPPEMSPLEQADALFDRREFDAALRLYQEQWQVQREEEFKSESRFKQGLCLTELRRDEEAAAVFAELFSTDGNRWPLMAGGQLWLLRLRQQHYAQAEAVSADLSLRFPFGQFALLVPYDVREQMLTVHRRELTNMHSILRFDPDRVRRMERTAEIDRFLSSDGQGTVGVQLQLARCYTFANDFRVAMPVYERLARSYPRNVQVQREYSRALRSTGQLERALEVVEQALSQYSDDGNPRAGLLLERARIRAAMNEWSRVESDVDEVLDIETRLAQLDPLCAGPCGLMKGCILDRRGDRPAAEKQWQASYRRVVTTLPKLATEGVGLVNSVPLYVVVLGSLSGQITEADAAAFLTWTTKGTENDVTVRLALSVMTSKTLAPTFRELCRSPRGRQFADDMAFERLTLRDRVRIPLLLTVSTYMAQNAFGGEFTPEQDELVWQLLEDGLSQLLDTGTLTVPMITLLASTWKGTTNNFVGWGRVAPHLSSEMRGRFSYVFAHRFLERKEPRLAAEFFQTALKEAPPDSQLAVLARTELKLLDAGRGRLYLEADSPQPVKVVVLQGGREVVSVGVESHAEVDLPEGTYQLALATDDDDFRLEMNEIAVPLVGRRSVGIRWLWRPSTTNDDPQGLIPRPAAFPGVFHWQIATVVPRGSAMSVAWSPDGETIAVGAEDNLIRLYDARDLQLRQIFAGHSDAVKGMAWSPDGTQLASCSGAYHDRSLRTWNVADGTPLRVIKVTDGRDVCSFDWSPDGTRLAMGGIGGEWRIWNVDGGEQISAQERESEFGYTTVAWSPDGQRLATATGDIFSVVKSDSDGCAVRVWNVADGHLLEKLKGHTALPTRVAWSRDGKWLASGGSDKTIRIWKEDGTPGPILEGHQGTIFSVRWSPDGRILASSSLDGTICLWEPQEAKKLRDINILAHDLAWHPASNRLAIAGTRWREVVFGVWDVAAAELVSRVGRPSLPMRSVDWNAEGKLLATAGDSSKVRLWEAASGRPLPRHLGHNRTVDRVAWHPRDSRLASGGDGDELQIWDTSTDAAPVTAVAQEERTSRTTALAWNPEGTALASASSSDTGSVRIWNPEKGTLEIAMRGKSHPIAAIAWSPLGDRIVATGSLNGAGVLRLWDARSGAEIRQENTSTSAALAWCADSERIFFGKNQIQSWDLQNSTLSSVVGSDRAGLSIRVSPNSRYLAAGGHSRIAHIWDVQYLAGGPTRWGWHQGSIESLSWSPNGSQLASVSSDSTLRLWNSATGEPQWLALLLPDESVAVFSPGGKLLHGNPESLEEHVLYVVGHPDGRTEILRPSAFEERLDHIKASDN